MSRILNQLLGQSCGNDLTIGKPWSTFSSIELVMQSLILFVLHRGFGDSMQGGFTTAE